MPLGLSNNKFNVFLVTCQDPQPPTGACKTRAAPYCIRKDIRTDFITGKVIDVRHLPSNGNVRIDEKLDSYRNSEKEKANQLKYRSSDFTDLDFGDVGWWVFKIEINKEKIRYILQFFFDKGEIASQTAEILNGVYGADTVTANYVQFWFHRFRSGIFDVTGTPHPSSKMSIKSQK
ncbi:histone-lysine N-methyltransferase SETMAR [Trichonephila clavipes]|nr:histone-lysine N-methyltransferase SETMAR [Trichonephila clavipes]